jgi:RNA polymerase sigma factor (sigma-70 family)
MVSSGEGDALEALALDCYNGSCDWAGLMRAATSIIETIAHRRLPADRVDDVVQDTLIGLYVGFANWDPERGTFRAFVAVQAMSRSIDELRRMRRQGDRSGELSAEPPDDAAAQSFAYIDDSDLIVAVFRILIAAGDRDGERVLAAARDLAYLNEKVTTAAIARRAELDRSRTRRALRRVADAVRRARGEP